MFVSVMWNCNNNSNYSTICGNYHSDIDAKAGLNVEICDIDFRAGCNG